LSLMKADPFLERRPLVLEYRDDSESDHGINSSGRRKKVPWSGPWRQTQKTGQTVHYAVT
jgi:hypothetical protein